MEIVCLIETLEWIICGAYSIFSAEKAPAAIFNSVSVDPNGEKCVSKW